MPKCPNCGQDSARTEDWACQWCGFPLVSKAYKKIPKTYRQLKEERQPKDKVEPESIPEPQLEPEPEIVPEPEPEAIPVAEIEAEQEPTPGPVKEPEPESQLETEAEVDEPSREPEPEPVSAPEPLLVETEPESRPEPELLTGQTPSRLTVGELYSRLKANKAAVEQEIKGKVITISGKVYRKVLIDNLDVYYVILTDPKSNGELQVSCTFNKEYESAIRRLSPGTEVEIQGKYAGFEAVVVMNDCTLL